MEGEDRKELNLYFFLISFDLFVGKVGNGI